LRIYQGLSSVALGGGERDPGNKLAMQEEVHKVWLKIFRNVKPKCNNKMDKDNLEGDKELPIIGGTLEEKQNGHYQMLTFIFFSYLQLKKYM